MREKAPKHQQYSFFAAIDAIPTPLLIATQNGQIQHLNTSARELLLLPEGSLVDQNIANFFSTDIVAEYQALLEQAAQEKSEQNCFTPQPTAIENYEGLMLNVELSISISYLSEKPIGIFSLIDVTKMFRENRQLESSNVELAHFASIAAHELQAPLRRIEGFLGLLQSGHDEQANDEESHWISRSIFNLQRMQSLVSSLLSMSRLNSDPIERASFSIESILQELVEALQGELEKSGTTINFEETFPLIRADRNKVTALLDNLLCNSINYGKGEGNAIEVGFLENTLPARELGAGSHSAPKSSEQTQHFQEGFVTLYVKDSGIGISKEKQQLIFDLFYRLHSYNEIKGHGIGLTICKRIVEAHGGNIWLESEESVGSTFYFNLPLHTID